MIEHRNEAMDPPDFLGTECKIAPERQTAREPDAGIIALGDELATNVALGIATREQVLAVVKLAFDAGAIRGALDACQNVLESFGQKPV
jgi:hypothetical protein